MRANADRPPIYRRFRFRERRSRRHRTQRHSETLTGGDPCTTHIPSSVLTRHLPDDEG
jgi:hypothetical protein